MKLMGLLYNKMNHSARLLLPYKKSRLLLKLVSIYVFTFLLLSVLLLPVTPLIGAEEEGDIEDGDSESISQSTKLDTLNNDDTSKTNDDSKDVDSTMNGESVNTKEGTDTTDSGGNDANNVDVVSDTTNDGTVNNDPNSGTGGQDDSIIEDTIIEGNKETNSNTETVFNQEKDNTNVNIDDSKSITDDNQENNQIINQEYNDETKNETILNVTDTDELNGKISDNTSTFSTNNNSSEVKKYLLIKNTNTNAINDTTETNASKVNNTDTTFESNLGNVKENEKLSVRTSPEETSETCIQKVDFISSKNQKNVKLQVSNLKEKPDEISIDLNISTTSKVYKYLDIKLTSDEVYIGETGIKQMNFSFSVERSWLENLSFNKFSIKMMRYHDDEWQELNTTYTNESEDYIFYQAETPGLSIFAVVGDKVVEEPDEIIIESSKMPWWMPASVIFISTVSLVVLLFKKRFVYSP